MCHMSHVTCHVSHVTCHMYFFYFLFFFGQSGEASQGRVCYQRGLPRLVLNQRRILDNLTLLVSFAQILLAQLFMVAESCFWN